MAVNVWLHSSARVRWELVALSVKNVSSLNRSNLTFCRKRFLQFFIVQLY